MDRPELTLFFPAYNEEANIEACVRQALERVSPLVGSIEILVVNDGSTDSTAPVCERLKSEIPQLRLINQPNGGYGVALATGFRQARGRLIAFSDSDLQFDLGEFALLLDRLHAPDAPKAVIGYRMSRADPPARIFIARVYNTLTALLFDLRLTGSDGRAERVRDIDGAMKVFEREVIDTLPFESRSPFLTAEILVKLRSRRVPMAQVGVHHYPRTAGDNTGASPRKVLRTMRDLLRLRLRLWFARNQSLYRVKPST